MWVVKTNLDSVTDPEELWDQGYCDIVFESRNGDYPVIRSISLFSDHGGLEEQASKHREKALYAAMLMAEALNKANFR